MQTIDDLLHDYLLDHEVAVTTEAYYQRTVSVLTGWHGQPLLREAFTPRLVSEFLRDMQQRGKSSYYRRSLRSGLRALLNFDGKREPIRAVRLEPLLPEAWNESEVSQLIAAVDRVIIKRKLCMCRKQWYWKRLIAVAWYTGLSQADLHRLEPAHISENGVVVIRRHKTGKRVIASLPEELATELRLRPSGPLFPLTTSKEYFRRQFSTIVKTAGLSGTFKRLRKSTGNAIELLYPGRGHEYLANTRAVFERHYQDHRMMPLNPLRPPQLA